MCLSLGLGEAALVPVAISIIDAYVPRDKLGTADGVFFAGATMGNALSFIVGGSVLATLAAANGLSLAGHHFRPWQGLFLLAAVPGIVAVVLLLTIP
jgi:MFS family permease